MPEAPPASDWGQDRPASGRPPGHAVLGEASASARWSTLASAVGAGAVVIRVYSLRVPSS